MQNDYQEIEARVNLTTTSPGVYLWKNQYGHVLYIGKAKNLRNRLKQYLKGAINSYKTQSLMDKARDFEVIVVHNDKEALILERNLINEYKPYFNILLTDDKRYPYIKITYDKNKLDVKYERIVKQNKANSIYYGPFPTGYGARIILRLLERELFYENGLLIQNKDAKFWLDKFNQAKEMLRFNNTNYLKYLDNEREKQAELLNFEIANEYKQAIFFLKELKEKQVVQLENIFNIDVWSFVRDGEFLFITVTFYRYGILINKLEETTKIKTTLENAINEFVKYYYYSNPVPEKFVIDPKFELNELPFDEKVEIIRPQKGVFKLILDNANANTINQIKSKADLFKSKAELSEKRIKSLESFLNYDNINTILMIDNSHSANQLPVSVIISYINGNKNKDGYRKFNLDEIENRQADVEYMRIALTRYFSKNQPPDLLIVDGGMAQVHEAKKTLKELNIEIAIIGLVKDEQHRTRAMIDIDENEKVISDPILFNFMTEMQVEVDRFAKSHFRKRSAQFSLEGDLDKIKGLGQNRINKLLNHFKTYTNIYNAEIEELAKIIPLKVAQEIKEKFGNKSFDEQK